MVEWLRDDWRVSLIRAPLATHPNVEGDYLTAPEASMTQLRDLVDGAIEHGMYIVVDFHAHKNFPKEAKEVLGTIAKEYGQHDNLIYAIWNEPEGSQEGNGPAEMWAEIKAYAQDVIPAIRAHAPDNIIVVPTPFYDQFPDLVSESPLTSEDLGGLPVDNIMYDIHVYAGQHKEDIRERADVALANGLPLIMTEIGRVGVDWGPDNEIDSVSFNQWMDWVNANDVSYTKWSLSYRDEKSSSLLPTAAADGNWTDADLTDEGRWNRAHFRRYGEEFYATVPCPRASD